MLKLSSILLGSAILILTPMSALADVANITSPREFLGHDVGEDYYLANYTQLEAYWKKLASESDRVRMIDIGETSEGRRQYMMVVSSPANLAKLEQYKGIAHSLASAKGLNDEQARALAKEGKAIVWIDGGMHASEIEPAQSLIQIVYDMLSRDDPETQNILDNVIVLFAHGNPDGQELVANWYMMDPIPEKRDRRGVGNVGGGGWLPRLYQKYVGHDNNRDFYLSAMKETTNINRVFFRDWFPQIILNQHQAGPPGTVVFMPPFRDPFNYNIDPLVMGELDSVSAAMSTRLIAENKPGAVMAADGAYSAWGNGMERTIGYFHNTVGVLTEIIGNPNPTPLPLSPSFQLPHNDMPFPIKPQMWHMRQSIDYSVSINRAVMDYAARNRETLLFNSYRMGSNGIEAGNRDNWTIDAARVADLKAAALAEPKADQDHYRNDVQKLTGMPSFFYKDIADPALYDKILHDPAKRDARAYIISAEQSDFPTAIKFLNALIKSGVEVERSEAPFTAGGKSYATGTFVVKTGQAYRAHVLDMFEAQHHPLDLAYPGGPPKAPYDVAGYTLAFQMGVQFDRVVDGFDANLSVMPDLITPPAGKVIGDGKAGFFVSHQVNDAFILTNRLLKAHLPVAWMKEPVRVDGYDFDPGAIWIPSSAASRSIVERAVHELGFDAVSVDQAPATPKISLHQQRIAVVDIYGGLMSGGWIQWMLDQFEMPYTVIYPQRVDAGKLKRDFDVVVLPDGAYTVAGYDAAGGMFRSAAGMGADQPLPDQIPAKYRSWLGSLTAEKSVPELDKFMHAGGSVVALGDSSAITSVLKIPLQTGVTETVGGVTKPASRTHFYIPGSLVNAVADNSDPLAFGLPKNIVMFFDRSPTFTLPADSSFKTPVKFGSGDILKSGWAVGPQYLAGRSAEVEAPMGRGDLILIGPEVAMRGQSQGVFKLLFNALQSPDR